MRIKSWITGAERRIKVSSTFSKVAGVQRAAPFGRRRNGGIPRPRRVTALAYLQARRGLSTFAATGSKQRPGSSRVPIYGIQTFVSLRNS